MDGQLLGLVASLLTFVGGAVLAWDQIQIVRHLGVEQGAKSFVDVVKQWKKERGRTVRITRW